MDIEYPRFLTPQGQGIHRGMSHTTSSRSPVGLTWSRIKLLIISRWRQHSGKCALLGTGAQDALRSPPCFLTIILLFHLFSFFFYFLLFLAKASVDFVMYDWESFDRQV